MIAPKGPSIQSVACSLFLLAATAASAMADDVLMKFQGKIGDIFGDRIVVETATKKYLVHLGGEGRDLPGVATGTDVEVEGEYKKSGEVRARSLRMDGMSFTFVDDDKRHRKHHGRHRGDDDGHGKGKHRRDHERGKDRGRDRD